MLDERAVKLEARLGAIEFAICELFSAFYFGKPSDAIHKRHDQWVQAIGKRGLKDVDPAISDLFSAEAENALRELLDLIELHSKIPRRKAEG